MRGTAIGRAADGVATSMVIFNGAPNKKPGSSLTLFALSIYCFFAVCASKGSPSHFRLEVPGTGKVENKEPTSCTFKQSFYSVLSSP